MLRCLIKYVCFPPSYVMLCVVLKTVQVLEGSNFSFMEVAIPPMRELDSLKDTDGAGLEDDEVLDDFISFINFAFSGHPRLLRAFVSVLSEAGYLLLQRGKRATGPAGEKEGEEEAEEHGEALGGHEEGKYLCREIVDIGKMGHGPSFYIEGYDTFFA